MNLEEYTASLGRVMALLQILETHLRMAIELLDPQPEHWRLLRFQAGEEVPYDAFSDYQGLRATIDRYNRLVAETDRLEADPLVRLRDARAHGRVFATGVASHPFRLIKFG